MSDAPQSAPAASEGLVRVIGPWALSANAINLTVGAGIFALPAVVAAQLGPAAIIAYLVCGALVALVLACFAEVGSRITRSGGAVAYIEEAFGPLAGFLAWVTFTIGFAAIADAAIANLLLDTAARFVPWLAGGFPRVAVMAAIFTLLAAVNVRGIRHGVRLAVTTTIAKLIPLVLLVVLGAFALDPALLVWTEWPSPGRIAAASLVLFFAFAGIESALTPSGEIRDPESTVPRGILGATTSLVLLYVAIQVTAQGVLGDDLAHQDAAPLATVASRLIGPAGVTLILIGTAVSVFGTLSADMIGSPRAVLAMAESGMLPAVLGRVHPRWRTPWAAIVAFAAVTFALAATGGFEALAVLASIPLLLIYLAVCLAVLRLRRMRPAPPGTFRTPGGPVVPIAGAATVVWLLSSVPATEALAMAAVLTVASLYYLIRKRPGEALRDAR